MDPATAFQGLHCRRNRRAKTGGCPAGIQWCRPRPACVHTGHCQGLQHCCGSMGRALGGVRCLLAGEGRRASEVLEAGSCKASPHLAVIHSGYLSLSPSPVSTLVITSVSPASDHHPICCPVVPPTPSFCCTCFLAPQPPRAL